jgi:hypothetical protein
MTATTTLQSTTSAGCGCDSAVDTPGPGEASSSDLPNTPFEALRVAYGMLLGEEDFRVLMGHPRGKLMLHQSWLHGRGAVWGLGLRTDGDLLTVRPGLAVDGWGRELRLTASWCVSVSAWAQRWLEDQETVVDCETVTVPVWIVAEYDACDGRPVPALANPCDVTRRHDDFSRTFESSRITMVERPPIDPPTFRRARMLLGLDDLSDDAAGKQTSAALDDVARAPYDRRVATLVEHFRRLIAADEIELEPIDGSGGDQGGDCPPLAPVPEEEAGVVLGRACLEIQAKGGCATLVGWEVDALVRPVLLPTRLVGELTCGLAPGVLGGSAGLDAGGPRLIRSSVSWTSDASKLVFCVTEPIAPGSEEGSVRISSLDDAGRGWSKDDVERIQLSADRREVRVFLDRRPTYDTVRIVVKGTGRTALFGADPRVPFAGLEGGPPGTEDDGHDAIVTMRLPGSPAPTSSNRKDQS